jgi:hypothetical protein
LVSAFPKGNPSGPFPSIVTFQLVLVVVLWLIVTVGQRHGGSSERPILDYQFLKLPALTWKLS